MQGVNVQLNKKGRRSLLISSVILSCLFLISIVSADDLSVIGNYPPKNTQTNSDLHPGFFPTVMVTITPEPTALPTVAKPLKTESPDTSGLSVVASAFILSADANNRKVIGGSVSNMPHDATVTIYGKKADGNKFNQIDIIKPDENGLFIYEIPEDQDNNEKFMVKVTSESGSASSDEFSIPKKASKTN